MTEMAEIIFNKRSKEVIEKLERDLRTKNVTAINTYEYSKEVEWFKLELYFLRRSFKVIHTDILFHVSR